MRQMPGGPPRKMCVFPCLATRHLYPVALNSELNIDYHGPAPGFIENEGKP